MLKESLHVNKGLRNPPGFQQYLTPSVLLGIILILGLALRLYDLGSESYWIDEMSTVVEGQQSLQHIFTSGRLDQPPAFYIPFHFWVQFFGDAEMSTRSFSVLTGIGSIVFVYIIGRILFGSSVGLLGAFFMAISEFQIYHSQIARFYSFFEFMTLLSFLFLILALRSKGIIHFALYGLSSILMIYSHTYGIFILVAQNLFFFIQAIKNRNAITIWLICQALIGLALLPYLFPLLFGAGGVREAIDFNIGGLSTPSVLDPLRSVYRFVLSPRRERSWEIMLVNYAAAGALLVAGTWVYAIRQGKGKFLTTAKGWGASLQQVPDVMSKILLLGCWLLCPILLPFFASWVIVPMYQDHYTISAAPAFYILLALGLYSIRRLVPLIISLGALTIMIVPGLAHYYVTDIHEQWRNVATYVNEKSETGDVIIFAPNMGIGIQQKSFNWYYPGTIEGCGLVSSKLADSSAISDAVTQCVSGHNRFWVIIANYSNVMDDERFKSFFLNPDQTTMRILAEQQFVGLSVYLFELTK